MTPIGWLLSGDTGVSSKTIFSVMMGEEITSAFGTDVPHDADDFGRCYRLLFRFPEWRERLPEVAERYPKWGPMVKAWDELTAMYEDAKITGASMRELCHRIHQLEDEGRIADGWIKKGTSLWVKP